MSLNVNLAIWFANHQPIYTDATILNIERLSYRGLSKFYDLLTEIDGYIASAVSSRFVIDRILRYVRNGRLVALVMPAVSPIDKVVNPKKLETLSGALPGSQGVNKKISPSDTDFKDLADMKDRLVYVVRRAPAFIDSATIKKALSEALTATAIITTVIVLAAWAASHFAGIGL